LECPQCKRPYTYNTADEALKEIGRNFGLIALLESMEERKKKQVQEEEEKKGSNTLANKNQEDELMRKIKELEEFKAANSKNT
jgi:hypothetical protein